MITGYLGLDCVIKQPCVRRSPLQMVSGGPGTHEPTFFLHLTGVGLWVGHLPCLTSDFAGVL